MSQATVENIERNRQERPCRERRERRQRLHANVDLDAVMAAVDDLTGDGTTAEEFRLSFGLQTE
jgi:hypothetical protein